MKINSTIIPITIFTTLLLNANTDVKKSSGKRGMKSNSEKTQKTNSNKIDDPLPYLELEFFLPEPEGYTLPEGIKKSIMFFIKTNPSREPVLRDEYKSIKNNPVMLAKWVKLQWNSEKYLKYFTIDYSDKAIKECATAEVNCEMYNRDCEKIKKLNEKVSETQKQGNEMFVRLQLLCITEIEQWASAVK